MASSEAHAIGALTYSQSDEPVWWALESASALIGRISAEPLRQRLDLLSVLTGSSPSLSAALALSLCALGDDESVAHVVHWMRRAGRIAGHQALSQLFHVDPTLPDLLRAELARAHGWSVHSR